MIIIIIKQFIKLVARKLKLCQLAETPYRMLPFSHVWKADLCTGKVLRMMPRCKSKAGVTLVEPYPRTVKTINFILFKPFTPEEGLAQSVSTRPLVLNVPILIPRCDLKSFFRLLSLLAACDVGETSQAARSQKKRLFSQAMLPSYRRKINTLTLTFAWSYICNWVKGKVN